MVMTPVVLAVSRTGEATARRIAAAINAPLHGRADRVRDADAFFPDALEHCRTLFASGTPVIGVCASGILIRAVAPLLGDKRAEPAVVSVSEDGAVVVPLLGGHRGANRMARRVADILEGVAAVTTAGDVALGISLDEPPVGWTLGTPERARNAMARLLSGSGARMIGEEAHSAGWLRALPKADPSTGDDDVVTVEATLSPGRAGALVFHPRRIALGVGCSRNCPPGELEALAMRVLDEAGVAPGALMGLFTLDLKSDEPAVNALASRLGTRLRLFTAAELESETPRLANPSRAVFTEVGCHGVAEAAALAAAGPEAVLRLAKTKSANATCALAAAPRPVTRVGGRSRGRLALVGIGPGEASMRTPEASRLVAEADEIVGYGLYIDLLGPLASGRRRSDFPLGSETARCRYSLERAGEGRSVALVCSGDAGIYAMGALIFELLDSDRDSLDLTDAARRVEIVVAPGVSALQAAAARAGAPMGNDFCAISLSDLLTPREDILRRVRAAAEGDFVVAFYNPVSKRRRDLLALARDILLKHRPGECPVMLASNVGRTGESLRYRQLAELDENGVDMLTLVIVGSSRTRLLRTGDGPRLYTPRGYARRIGELSNAI